MDLRSAAEERASHSRRLLETAQEEKKRSSVRNRAITVSKNASDFQEILELAENNPQNPEENIEIDTSASALTLVERPSTKSPYKDTNQQYNLTKRSRHKRADDDSPVRESLTEMYYDSVKQDNVTPKLAKLNESEYKLNGVRARAGSGEYVRPRWIPDDAQDNCMFCSKEFDFVNRRHHCRNCGLLVCDSCSPHKLLLPPEFGIRDPERVCNTCYETLLPMQSSLCNQIANHERENTIMPIFDDDFSSCHMRRYANLPFSLTLGSEIRKAAYSVYNLFNLQYLQDKGIPLKLLAQAKGLAFLTVVKGGFVFAPRIGTGLVISRLSYGRDSRWSAPSAIGTIGVSWGAIIGVDLTDYVIVLNTEAAVEAFCNNAQLTLGAGLDIAVGPVGRSGSLDMHISATGLTPPAFSYSHSRGVFAGVSLDGTAIVTRGSVNNNFYGRTVSASDLLHGAIPPPRAAKPLYNALAEALSALPDVEHYAPSPVMGRLMNIASSAQVPS